MSNNDLISRKAAIDAILAEVEDEDRPIVETRWWNMGMTRASVIVHDMPSAQPETPSREKNNAATVQVER